MKAIDIRRALGLIMLGSGLLLAAIYFSGQFNQLLPGAPATQIYYGPLVPTVIGQTSFSTPSDQSNALSLASSTIVVESTHMPRVSTATATLARSKTSTTSPSNTATRQSKTTRAAAVTAAPQQTRTSAVTTITTTPRRTRTSAALTSTTAPQQPATVSAATPTMPPSPLPPAAPIMQAPYSRRQRVCVGVPYPGSAAKPLSELRPGWYLNWTYSTSPGRPGGAEYAQMVRVPQGKIVPDLGTIAQIAQQNPGALWLIGNEMDVIWQDNATPEQYVAAYHEVYTTLKQADPYSRVAIGGVSEPSPLRLQYLDQVLQVYRERHGQAMPIDVWNVHNFILPEVRGSWGVDIPPGMAAASGLTYAIDDHDNLDYFKQQLIDFRRWLAARGYRDKELLVSEYGILMYEDYGFDYPRVRQFMLGTFEIMHNTTDASVGLPADGNRLVQRWCWYSLADTNYPTGNLADPASGELTPLGHDLKAYLDGQIP